MVDGQSIHNLIVILTNQVEVAELDIIVVDDDGEQIDSDIDDDNLIIIEIMDEVDELDEFDEMPYYLDVSEVIDEYE